MYKVKLLIVSPHLSQAGSERWVYEICKHIDREKFDIAVLCDSGYKKVGQKVDHYNYYYHELKKLRISLYPFIDYVRWANYKPIHRIERTLNRAYNRVFNGKNVSLNPKAIKLLQSYDVICVMDAYLYETIKTELHQWCGDKFFIVLHCHKMQFGHDLYRSFEKDFHYNLTYFCPKQIDDLRESGLDTQKSSLFNNPLLLNLSGYPNLFNPITEAPVVISIFTRITEMKPIDVFIEAFARLQKCSPRKCVLNIYGEIQSEDYRQQLENLSSELTVEKNTVRFVGHTKDIANTIKNDRINVYWGLAVNTNTGYASIEVGAMGVPSFFWNLDPETDYVSILSESGNAIRAHNRTEDFVADNLKYINDDALLAGLSIERREYLINRHDIVDRIKNFEDYVISIAPR